MEAVFTEELKNQVEAASGGKQTVLRTAKGQATYMNVIPAFNLEDLGGGYGTGLHPAFLVGGVEKSKILIGTYQAVILNGEALSLPGQDPTINVDFDRARAVCVAAGPGFHLMTNWEWAAIALWCEKNGFGQLRGNTDWGKSHANPGEAGTRAGSSYRTLTRSGPDSWRHDGTPFGIADLVGNVWEWVDGLKLVGGRILMPVGNDFNLDESAWPDTGACIDFHEDGARISNEITAREWDDVRFADLGVQPGYELSIALKQALLAPAPGQNLTGHLWADTSEDFEALPIRGGSWGSGSGAGLAALALTCGRSVADSDLGFRPAFIE